MTTSPLLCIIGSLKTCRLTPEYLRLCSALSGLPARLHGGDVSQGQIQLLFVPRGSTKHPIRGRDLFDGTYKVVCVGRYSPAFFPSRFVITPKVLFRSSSNAGIFQGFTE